MEDRIDYLRLRDYSEEHNLSEFPGSFPVTFDSSVEEGMTVVSEETKSVIGILSLEENFVLSFINQIDSKQFITQQDNIFAFINVPQIFSAVSGFLRDNTSVIPGLTEESIKLFDEASAKNIEEIEKSFR